MEKGTEIILPSSDKAAHYRTDIKGWVSGNGRFFGDDERAARYDGSTHQECSECQTPVEHPWLVCQSCRTSKRIEKFNGFKVEVWDCETPLNLFDSDVYFFDVDDIEYYCEDNEIKPSDLALVKCVPTYPRFLDDSYWEDELPEDWDIRDYSVELTKKINELNQCIKSINKPMSWHASNVRIQLLDDLFSDEEVCDG